MATATTKAPEIVRPAGSHWLELDKHGNNRAEVFAREELHPIIECDAPRVGRVRAQFSVDRYVSTSGWGDWRIILRDVKDAEALPESGYHRDAAGVGPATRKVISEQCEPLIREWLDSDGYKASRQRVAAATVKRELDAPADYTLRRARETFERVKGDGELAGRDVASFGKVFALLQEAVEELDLIGKEPAEAV